MLRVDSNANGGFTQGFTPETELQALDPFTDFLCPHLCGFSVGVRQDDDEFLAAVSADDVFSPDNASEHFGNFAKNEVSSFVAEGVVEVFEVVHII